MVAVLLQDMYERVWGANLVVVAMIRLLLPWFDMPSERWNNSKLEWYIVVAVKLNIILNQAQLLVISIYLIDLCRRIVCVAFHLDILHRLGMTLKIPQKWHMRGSTGAL